MPVCRKREMKIYRNDLLVLMLALAITMTTRAQAYLDMGSGSMFLQMLVAGSLGAVFTAKSYWNSIRQKLSSRKADKPSN